MRSYRETTSALAREAAIGAALGFVILGLGGRVAMRAVAVALGQPGVLNVEGTLTVAISGAIAGVAAAMLYAVARTAARVTVSAESWRRIVHLVLFSILLGLVTARGLRGSAGPHWPFWLLVAMHGVAFHVIVVARRREGACAGDADAPVLHAAAVP